MRTKSLAGAFGFLAALGVASAASASPAGIGITLALKGSAHRTTVQTVSLVATAKLPAADRILIQGKRSGDPTPLKVKECGTSPCAGSWREQEDGAVSFQALVIRRAGTKMTVLGKSKAVGVTWQEAAPPPPPPPAPPPPPTPPPAPPPPPPASSGSYSGVTSQGFQLTFHLSGTAVINLQFSEVDLSAGGCSGAGLGNFSGIGWSLGYYTAVISPSGAFSIDRQFTGSDSDLGPYNVTVHISGQFSGSSATGTMSLGMTFNYQGVDQNCASNLSWNAST